MKEPLMQPQPSSAAQWRRFVVSAVAIFALQQLVGLLLFSYPLTSHVVPTAFGSLVLAWAFTFRPLWFRRSP